MLDLLELEQLAAFAEYGTLSKAAQELHISQPTLTRTMKRLGEEFGVPLFVRGKNKIELNETGAEAAACAKRMLALAEHTLQDFFATDVEIKPTDIITQVAKYFYITFDDIVGRSRTKKIALARQIAMYLVRELTSMSLNDIGQVFGGKDHTTVMHAYTRISDEMQEKQEIYNYVTELTLQLKQRSGEK